MEEGRALNSGLLGMTDAVVTEHFGRLYDWYPSDDEAEEKLAALFDVSPNTIRIQNRKRLQGADLTATILNKMCWLIEKAQIEQTYLSDSALLQHGPFLRRKALDELRAELQGAIEAREADLKRREKDSAEKMEVAWAEVKVQTERWQRGLADLARQKEALEAGKTAMARDKEEVERRESDVTRKENRARIVLEEFRKEDGLLDPSPTKSTLRAFLELEERRLHNFTNSPAAEKAKMELAHRERKERVFNILAAPLRLILAIAMS